MKKEQEAQSSIPHRQYPFQQLDDETLVRQLIAQPASKALREALYIRFAPLIYERALAIVRDQALAEDLTHDIILKIMLKIKSFSFRSSFRYWVWRVTYNHCINFINRKKKEITTDWEKAPHTFTETAYEPTGLHQEVQLYKLEQAIQQLSEQECAMLWMRYRDNIPVAEMAAIYQIGESAMKMRLKRLRDKLANIYKSIDDEQI